jgi:putative mRNA 3-end processing factor
VVSGDYKRDEDPTCAPFEVVPCDTFITEATFGLPVFQWKPAREVTLEILEWWRENSTQGINSLLYCYALGKAQRVLAELARHPLDLPIFIHESIEPLNACYHAQEVTLAPSRTLSSQSHGVAIFGALILIPPGFAGTPIIRRLGEHKTGFASGWMSTRQSMMGRQYDRSFTLSDHADWPSLLRTVRETGARRVYVMHGDDEALIKSLRETGVDAQPISALRD